MSVKSFVLGASALVLSGLLGSTAMANDAEAPAALTADDVRAIVGEYIRENAADVVAVIEEHIAEQHAIEQQRTWYNYMSKANDNRDALLDEEPVSILGNPDADISIVYFQDFNCIHCKSMYETINTIVEENDDVRVLNRYFPIFGEGSTQAAVYALAVNAVVPEKIAEVHEAFYTHQGQLEQMNIVGHLVEVLEEEQTVEVDNWLQDTDNQEKLEAVLATNMELATNLEIKGTPFFVILTDDDHVVLPGAVGIESFNEALERLRSDAPADSSVNPEASE